MIRWRLFFGEFKKSCHLLNHKKVRTAKKKECSVVMKFKVAYSFYKGDDRMKEESYFDGGLLQLIGWSMLGFLITVLSIGILYPWALVMVYGWRINHTVINGKRLKFSGTAMGLFGNWIKWLLLMIITLGIYSFWVGIALEKWRVKNTSFVE